VCFAAVLRASPIISKTNSKLRFFGKIKKLLSGQQLPISTLVLSALGKNDLVTKIYARISIPYLEMEEHEKSKLYDRVPNANV